MHQLRSLWDCLGWSEPKQYPDSWVKVVLSCLAASAHSSVHSHVGCVILPVSRTVKLDISGTNLDTRAAQGDVLRVPLSWSYGRIISIPHVADRILRRHFIYLWHGTEFGWVRRNEHWCFLQLATCSPLNELSLSPLLLPILMLTVTHTLATDVGGIHSCLLQLMNYLNEFVHRI